MNAQFEMSIYKPLRMFNRWNSHCLSSAFMLLPPAQEMTKISGRQ